MTSSNSRRKKNPIHLRSRALVARRVKRILLRAAGRGETVTYGTLMKTFGLSRGKVLSGMIGEVDRRECARGAPGFAAMIVRKDTGYPGGGYFCDEALPPGLRRPKSRRNDPILSPAERECISRQQKRIWKHYSAAARSAHS